MSDTLFQSYRDLSASLKDSLPGFDPLRSEALSGLERVGVPNRKSEAFRYATLKTLKSDAFGLADGAHSVETAPTPLVEKRAGRLVFINGRLNAEQSDRSGLDARLKVHSLKDHMAAGAGQSGGDVAGADMLALLNTALTTDGAAITVPADCAPENALEIVHIMVGAEKTSAHPRHMITVEDGATLTLVERMVGDNSAYWFNETVSIRIGKGAKLTHIRLQEDGEQAASTCRAQVDIDADGVYAGLTVAKGYGEARFEARVRLLGEGAHADLDGIMLAQNAARQEILTDVTHVVPNATSDQIIRTLSQTRGSATLQGKIIVEARAQKTEADMSVKSLLLDRSGEANAKPELEIHADDVKCSHGATVGELDAQALFYLTSRGVDPDSARQILVDAFTDEALRAAESVDGLAEGLRQSVADWMLEEAQA